MRLKLKEKLELSASTVAFISSRVFYSILEAYRNSADAASFSPTYLFILLFHISRFSFNH